MRRHATRFLGAQMILWDDGFCAALAERSFFVIRFDNRDIGKSTRINGEAPPLPKLLEKALTGKPVEAHFTMTLPGKSPEAHETLSAFTSATVSAGARLCDPNRRHRGVLFD